MAGTLSTVTVRIASNQIVLNAPALAVAAGDYFHWRFDKGTIGAASIDFPVSKLFSGGAHFPADWINNPKLCEFVRELPDVVPDAAKGGRYEYYIAAVPIGCHEALVVKGEIVVAA